MTASRPIVPLRRAAIAAFAAWAALTATGSRADDLTVVSIPAMTGPAAFGGVP